MYIINFRNNRNQINLNVTCKRKELVLKLIRNEMLENIINTSIEVKTVRKG